MCKQLTIGMDLAAGEVPQLTVKAGHWQTASARDDLCWCLVTSPGFVFDSFELAPQNFSPALFSNISISDKRKDHSDFKLDVIVI